MSAKRAAVGPLLGLIGLWSAGAGAADLISLYQDALRHDTQYAMAHMRKQVGDEQAVQARAGLLPHLTLDTQTNLSETQYEVYGGSIEQRRQSRSYGVQLVQPVFRWENWVAYQQGDLHKAVAQVRLHQSAQDLIVRLATAYFAVLQSEEVYRAIAELRKADAEQLASARKHFELGNVSSADVHEAQASFDRAGAQLIKASNDRSIAQQALARIIGRPAGTLEVLAGPMLLEAPQPAAVEAWLAAAQSSNPDIQAQRILLDIATLEVARHKSKHLPAVDMFVARNVQQNPSVSTEQSDASSIGLRLSMPLYSGGRTQSAVRAAAAEQAHAEYALEDVRRAVNAATWDAWSQVMTGIAQVRALEAAKKSAQMAVDANRLGYSVGVRVSIDVLEVQGQLSETVQQLSQARYDTLLAQLKLKAAVGALQGRDLISINALLHHR